MENKRIHALSDAPENKTDYYLALDKSGIAEATKYLRSAFVTECQTGSQPVISTPTITEVTDGDTVTTTVSKKAVHGKTHAFNMNFSVDLSVPKTTLLFTFSGNSLGSVGQSLSALVDNNMTIDSCLVTDDSPLTITVVLSGTPASTVHNFYINGTLITTS